MIHDSASSLLLFCLNSYLLMAVNYGFSPRHRTLPLHYMDSSGSSQGSASDTTQEFGTAVLRIQLLLPSPHLSMTASSTTYIRKISTLANLIMSLPFTDNRLCLLKSFLFAIVLHPVSSTSCFYILLSFSQAKPAVAAWKKCFLFIFLQGLGTRFMKHYETDMNYFI